MDLGKAHYHVGDVERQVGMAKGSCRALFNLDTNPWSKQEAMSIICASRNIAPFCNSQLSPLSAIDGRNDLIGRTSQSIPPGANAMKADGVGHWGRLKSIFDTSALLLEIDPRLLRKLDMSKKLRIGVLANYEYSHDQKVYIWLPTLKKWNGECRFLHHSGRNAIAERGHRLLKTPLAMGSPGPGWGKCFNEFSPTNYLRFDIQSERRHTGRNNS